MDMKPGDLVILTKAYENYVLKTHPGLRVSLANRLAKLEEIIDWDSDKGKKIKELRLKSGNWKDLPLEDNRYMVSIFFPELMGRKGQRGVVQRGQPMFSRDPETEAPFFIPVPGWMYREIAKKCEEFDVDVS